MGSNQTRRGFIGTTTAVGVGALAGCLGDDDAEDDDSGGTGNGDDGGDDTVELGDEDADHEVVVWHGMGGGLGEAFEEIAGEFEDENVRLSLQYQGSYRDVLNNTFAAQGTDDFPDVVQIARYETRQVLDSGFFQPVENVLPDDYPVDDFLPALTNYFTVDDTLQSLPFNNSNAIGYYNRTMLEDAGLDPDDAPDTLETVREYGAACVDEGLCDYAITWPNHMWFIENWYALQGETLFDNGNGREDFASTINLDQGPGLEVHEWWYDLNQNDLFLDPGEEAWGEATDAFLNEEAPIMINTTAQVRGVVNDADFEAETMFHPTIGDRVGTPIGGGSFWVDDDLDDDKVDAVGSFISHMTDTDQQIFWHQQTGYYPVRQSGLDALEDEGWFEENPQFRTAVDQLQNTEPTAATAGAMIGDSHEIRSTVQEASYDVIESGEFDSRLGQAREDCEQILENYRADVE